MRDARIKMTEQVNFITAFTAGLLSFISPCVLPLVPAYLSYISGVSLDAMRGKPEEKGTGRKSNHQHIVVCAWVSVLCFALLAQQQVISDNI